MAPISRAAAGTAVTAVALALAGIAALALAWRDQEPRPPAAPAIVAPSGQPGSPTASPASASLSARAPAAGPEENADQLHGLVLPGADPVALRIPRIGVSTPLVGLGLDDAGALEAPTVPGEAGWFSAGPSPGSLGPAVIAGHVTWNHAPAVFFRLGDLRGGDRVEVRRADGRHAVFAVERVMRFAKSRFPTRVVYGPTDHAALRLITCGGRYDRDRSSYEDNVVVFATLVAVREP